MKDIINEPDFETLRRDTEQRCLQGIGTLMKTEDTQSTKK